MESCLLPPAYCLRPPAYCLPPTAYCRPLPAFRLLLTASLPFHHLHERRQNIDRDRQDRHGASLGRDLSHTLQVPELERDGFLCDERGGLGQLGRCLELALRVDDFGAT